ncbi:hypothetical protein F4809DRAFT_659859 [Biscogniauxia mediterranea]|nr:hypothetical protein F4809DRAFT_659859 [Biscogniauxia mediterranea]
MRQMTIVSPSHVRLLSAPCPIHHQTPTPSWTPALAHPSEKPREPSTRYHCPTTPTKPAAPTPEATAHFQRILSAYKTLSDESQRREHEHDHNYHGCRTAAASGHHNQQPSPKKHGKDKSSSKKNKKKKPYPTRASVLVAFSHKRVGELLLPGVSELVLGVSAIPAEISRSSSSSPAAQGAIRRKTAEFQSARRRVRAAPRKATERERVSRRMKEDWGEDDGWCWCCRCWCFGGRQHLNDGERRDLVVQFAAVLNLWP